MLKLTHMLALHKVWTKRTPPKHNSQQKKMEWQQVFRVKKKSWGCCPNSNYLLSSVVGQDTTTCHNNAIAYRKYEHTVSSTNSAHCWRQVNYMFSVHAKLSYANTASKPLNGRLTPSQSLVLLLFIVLGSAAKIVSRKATNWTRCKWYGCVFQG